MKTILAILFFAPFLAISQIVIKGSILDSSNNPIPFATIGLINEPIGTICNENGHYVLRLNKKFQQDSLLISHVGFNAKKVAISSLLNSSQNEITLTESVLQLDQVIVTAESAKSRFIRAVSKVKKNYDYSPTKYTFFTSRENFTNNNPNYILEAVAQMKTSKGNVQFSIEKLRGKVASEGSKKDFKKERSIWIGVIKYQRVERLSSWKLQKSELRFYDYAFDSSLLVNNRLTHIIKAIPNERGIKKHRNPIDYFIDDETDAIIKCKEYGDWEEEVEYQKIEDFWYVKSYFRNVPKGYIDPSESWKLTFIVTEVSRQYTGDFDPLGYKIVQEVKYRIEDWDDSFWDEYNVIQTDDIWFE